MKMCNSPKLNSLLNRTIFTGFVLLVFGSSVAESAEAEANAATLSNPDDVRLIIDISGSMKQNDPGNLRIPAVNMLVKLIPHGAFAGIWIFGQQVNMLVPLQRVDSTWKKSALASAKKINSTGLYTNIGAALEEALIKRPGGTAILLTDGVVDITKDPVANAKEVTRIIDELLPQLVASGAQVHTVALSDQTDEALLKEIAMSTGGMFDIANSPEDLSRIFLRMFDDAVTQDRLPMDGGKFVVDSSVEEFTLLAFTTADPTPIQLRSPENEFFMESSHPDYVSWYIDSGFELITVKQPLEGTWQLFADSDAQNRVTVLSDLKLRVSNLSNTVFEGGKPVISVSFFNEVARITDRNFLDVMDVQLVVEMPDGGQRAKRLTDYTDGVFSSTLDVFDTPGRYQIKVSVDGKTFQREMVQELEYLAPVKVEHIEDDGILKVTPTSRALVNEDIKVIASITDTTDKKRFLPMRLVDGKHWQASLQNFEPGRYLVNLHMEGSSSTGQYVNFNSVPMQIVVGAVDIVEAVPEPVDEQPEPVEEAESAVSQYLFYIMALLGNLGIGGLAFWFYRVKRSETDVSEEDEEIAALLAHGASGVTEDEVPESTSENEEEEEEEEEEETEYGSGLSDIVDAWGDEPVDETMNITTEPSSAADDSESPLLQSLEIDEPESALLQSLETYESEPESALLQPLETDESEPESALLQPLETDESELESALLQPLETYESEPESALLHSLETDESEPEAVLLQNLQADGSLEVTSEEDQDDETEVEESEQPELGVAEQDDLELTDLEATEPEMAEPEMVEKNVAEQESTELEIEDSETGDMADELILSESDSLQSDEEEETEEPGDASNELIPTLDSEAASDVSAGASDSEDGQEAEDILDDEDDALDQEAIDKLSQTMEMNPPPEDPAAP